MAKQKILGRAEEQARLQDCMQEDSAQLIIVYGRRRVGKTFLINEFFDNRFAFKLTGAYQVPKKQQLRNFQTALKRSSGKGWEIPKDWNEAFSFLREYLEELPREEKQVVFFDEMPWIDTQKSGFLQEFEWFWNDWASTQDNLVLIACGSATSWMIDHLVNNKGGLFDRHTCRLYLKPFNLAETEAFLRSRNLLWSRYEIAECYMIMGGIPYYLRQLSGRYSLSQNIDRLFFQQNGLLWDEFEHLYRSLFSNSDQYVRIVEALSRKTSGMTRGELLKIPGIPQNGTLTKMLNNLVYSGFVRISTFYGKKKKDILYQLSDYYTAFYFRFIRDHYGKDEHYWSHATDNPGRRAWAGLTFEQLCKDHIPQIKQRLGISGVLSEESIWFTQGDPELNIPGAQIDLILSRRDRVIHLCEMKFSVNEYIIDKAYDSVLRNKLDAFRRMADDRQTLLMTMITTYGVKKNQYSNFIQSQVKLDDLFEEEIPL